MINVIGPHYDDGRPWESTEKLQTALADVPENGTFHWGLHRSGEMWNKLRQLQKMQEANLPVIPFTAILDEARQWVGDGHTVFGRHLRHTAGDDITVNKVRSTTRKFWTRYVPSKAEWRIHIFDGLSIARWKKLYGPMPEPITAEVINQRARRYSAAIGINPPEGMRQIAKLALAACEPLTYGAVDILVGQDGEPYLLEINTAPELDRYTCAAYVRAIRRRFRSDCDWAF